MHILILKISMKVCAVTFFVDGGFTGAYMNCFCRIDVFFDTVLCGTSFPKYAGQGSIR